MQHRSVIDHSTKSLLSLSILSMSILIVFMLSVSRFPVLLKSCVSEIAYGQAYE